MCIPPVENINKRERKEKEGEKCAHLTARRHTDDIVLNLVVVLAAAAAAGRGGGNQ